MERAEIHELSAAYALDALEGNDLEAFEEHLARCAECRENVTTFQRAAAELAYDVDAPEPPAALRNRILDQAASERPKVVPLPRRRWALPVAAAAAVAAGIAAVGLAFWAADLSQQLDDVQAEQHRANEALIALIDPSASHFALEGADGVLVVDAESGEGSLVISGLEGAPSEKTYEAWVIEGDQAVPAGLFSGGGEQTVVPLTVPVPEGAIVAVTVEQAGGVDQPTQQPIITSEQTRAVTVRLQPRPDARIRGFVLLGRRRRRASVRPRRIRKLRFLALLTVIACVMTVSFMYGLVSSIASELPQLEPGKERRSERLGYIYASDGKTVLAVLRGSESRIVVRSEQISPVMKQAIVAVEDRRFWEHRGVDFQGHGARRLGRHPLAEHRPGRLDDHAAVRQEPVHAAGADGQPQAQGGRARVAARAALVEGPHPHRLPEHHLLRQRRLRDRDGGARVLRQAGRGADAARGRAARGDAGEPAALRPGARPGRSQGAADDRAAPDARAGPDHACRLPQRRRGAPPRPEDIGLPGFKGRVGYFAEYVKQQLIPYYGSGEVFGGGLKIYTSIDLELQNISREVISHWLPDPDGPRAALVAVDPRDGRVLAMYGGDNFRKSQFNLAVQGQRQTGSSFKPFVLTTAVEEGISPQTVFTSQPTTINLGDKLWSVHNYEGSYLGQIDLAGRRRSLRQLGLRPADGASRAEERRRHGPRLGVTRPLDDFFAIGLGVEAVSPLEMARAFASFANNGERIDGSVLGNVPRAVLRVEDGAGPTRTPRRREGRRPERRAIVNSILQRVVTEGTGQRARARRPARRRQDGHDRELRRRLVRRLHAAARVAASGSATRTGCSRWRPSSRATLSPAARSRRSSGSASPSAPSPTSTSRRESFPYPVIRVRRPLLVVNRNNKVLLDNGNCKRSRQILYFAGSGPEAEATCKPNEVDVPSVIGSRLGEARSHLYSMPLTAGGHLAAGEARRRSLATSSTRSRSRARSPPGARFASSSPAPATAGCPTSSG